MKWYILVVLVMGFSELIVYLFFQSWKNDQKAAPPTKAMEGEYYLMGMIIWPSLIIQMLINIPRTKHHIKETCVSCFLVLYMTCISTYFFQNSSLEAFVGTLKFSLAVVMGWTMVSIIIVSFMEGIRTGTLFDD